MTFHRAGLFNVEKKAEKLLLSGIFGTFFVKNLEIPEKGANLALDYFLLCSIYPFLRVLTNPFS